MPQLPRMPDLAAQRAAMQKLNFLVGDWAGHGRMYRAGETWDFAQTEHAEYKQDRLLLLIEGVARAGVDGKGAMQALGIFSYDDAAGVYFMRAYNDGRYLETEVNLGATGQELRWGFVLGEIRTRSLLRFDEQGRWTELHEIAIGAEPFRKFMELIVSRQE